MPAAIYARISNDDNDDKLGVDRQERLCRSLAQRAGLVVGPVLIDDDVSAYKSKKRPTSSGKQVHTVLERESAPDERRGVRSSSGAASVVAPSAPPAGFLAGVVQALYGV